MAAKPPTQDVLTRASKWLDDKMRFADLLTRRTSGGWMDTKLKIGRHSGAGLLLPSAMCGLLLLESPTPAHGVAAVLTSIVVGVVLFYAMRWTTRRGAPIWLDFASQCALISVLVGGIWLGSPDEYSPTRPYRDLLTPLTIGAAISLLCGAMLLPRLFAWLREQSLYAQYLKQTELFASREGMPPLSLGTVLVSAVAVAVRAPLALLTLPALVILLAPPAFVTLALLLSGLFYLAGLVFAGLNDRFGMMWSLLQESFFKGGALLISLVVIALATARLAGISYVTTVFDSAAWWTIALLLAKAYVLSWWFDYWSHRLLTDEVLRVIEPTSKGSAVIPYDIVAAAKATTVPIDKRYLQVHGAARFLVIRESGLKMPYFQAWSPVELVNLLASAGAPGGKAVPPPHLIASRIATYQAITGLIFAILVGVTLWQIHIGYQMPEAVVRTRPTGISFSNLVDKQLQEASDDPVFIVAASGGGTRAAIYTASILEGIAHQGKASKIVLGSGVSGGGAALAYFAGHRPELIAPDSDEAWEKYFYVMSRPYIQDVLEQSTEWYMVKGGRLGMLLAQSFEHRWSMPVERRSLAQIADFGLILNTSLAGHFKSPGCVPQCPLSSASGS